MATLQKQGVPIPSHLSGPQPSNVGAPNGPQTRSSSPSRTSSGSAPRRTTSTTSKSVGNSQPRRTNGPKSLSAGNVPNPVSAGNNATSGVGLLEAEFLTAMAILVLLMFSSDASMTDKMMSTLKRGTLTCAVFFVLAIVAGIGPNAAKATKAFGALVIVAILIQSDIGTVLTDLDGIIKNDWIGTTPSSDAASGDTGTAATASKSTPASDLESDLAQAAETAINPAGHVLKPLLAKIGINIP
jgi:hypothetical protein